MELSWFELEAAVASWCGATTELPILAVTAAVARSLPLSHPQIRRSRGEDIPDETAARLDNVLPLGLDAWGGFPAEREKIFRTAQVCCAILARVPPPTRPPRTFELLSTLGMCVRRLVAGIRHMHPACEAPPFAARLHSTGGCCWPELCAGALSQGCVAYDVMPTRNLEGVEVHSWLEPAAVMWLGQPLLRHKKPPSGLRSWPHDRQRV
eukprot:365845-Chlamydomonas_euryale.AAC.2